jgi:hypothetical protein
VATGDILAVIDDDTEVLPGWAAALRRGFADGPALVGGRILAPPPRTLAQWYRGRFASHDVNGRHGFLPFICGANLAIRAEVFRHLGGFDEVLPGSEDMDLSFRVQLSGWEISYAPEAALMHWLRASMTGMLRQRAHHILADRVLTLKYLEFPIQRTKLWRRPAARAVLVQTAGQLLTGVRGEWRRLTYPALTGATGVAQWLGVLKADLRLLTGRQPAPEPFPCLDERLRWTATELPPGPSVLLLGADRLVARVLRIALEASGDLLVAPGALAEQALAHWDDPAPPHDDLARRARSGGWLIPREIAVRRLAREQPRTWGEAVCVLHALQAALLRRPRFGLLALGDATVMMARRFPELPVVAIGDDSTVPGRVIYRVTRRALLRDRRSVIRELRRALSDQVPATGWPIPARPLAAAADVARDAGTDWDSSQAPRVPLLRPEGLRGALPVRR